MDPSAIIALAIGVPTFLAAAATFVLQLKARRDGPQLARRRRVAQKLSEGLALRQEAFNGEPDRDFAELWTRVEQWYVDAEAVLKKEAPDQVPVLRGPSGLTLYSSSQYAERDRVTNFLEERCHLLTQILGRI